MILVMCSQLIVFLLKINCSDFDLGQLRSSVGIGITWLSGFGPLSSISNIIDKQPLDRTENFQFSIGRVF